MKPVKPRRKPKFPLPSPPPPNQTGLINQAGAGNSQTIHLKLVNKVRDCAACSLKQQLALSQALVASQAETIALLRTSHRLP